MKMLPSLHHYHVRPSYSAAIVPAKVPDVYMYLPASDKLTLAGNEASKKLLPSSEHGGTLSQRFSRQKSPSPLNQLGREEVEYGQRSVALLLKEFLEIIHHLLS